MAKEVLMSEARSNLSKLVDEVRMNTRDIIIRLREVPAAVLMNMERYNRLTQIEDKLLAIELRDALKGGTRPLEKVLEELKLDV